MSRAGLINSRGIAEKVKDCGATRECPSCHHLIRNSDVSPDWSVLPGLPAGVKFEPSDIELLDHLAAKCGVESSKPHMLIDEFIPTLDTDQGICYTHPQNLPGIRKDGISVHFFHKTSNAYATGPRKRRKIESYDGFEEDARWHKTGKTKAVTANGVQKGCKKILVLYTSSKKGSKPDKTNWVMHQYHLGSEDEKEGEFVVSKVFYQQQKQCGKIDKNNVKIENLDVEKTGTSPRTPKANQEEDSALELYGAGSSSFSLEDITDYMACLARESQANINCDLNNGLGCDSHTFVNDLGLDQNDQNTNEAVEHGNVLCAIADPAGIIDSDTPPGLLLNDLQFGSPDSVLGGLDKDVGDEEKKLHKNQFIL